MEARLLATFLLVLFMAAAASESSAATTSSSTADPKSYVKTACQKATYPGLCYSSLSSYAGTIKSNPWRLCGSALMVSLKYARKAKSAFSSMTKIDTLTKAEKAALKQCRDTMANSINQLKQSANIMSDIIKARSSSSSSRSYSASEMNYKMSNVKTYVSGAITDDSTCTDGLDEEPVSTALKKKAMKWESAVERLTSNALALINSLNY